MDITARIEAKKLADKAQLSRVNTITQNLVAQLGPFLARGVKIVDVDETGNFTLKCRSNGHTAKFSCEDSVEYDCVIALEVNGERVLP